MKMKDMLTYLEAKGFVATKFYIPEEKIYKFRISKGEAAVTGEFRYPETATEREKDELQREFLDNLILDFHRKVEDWPSRVLNDAKFRMTTGMLQINGSRMPVRITEVGEVTPGRFPRVECAVLFSNKHMSTLDGLREYCERDVEATKLLIKTMINSTYGANGQYRPQIKDVMFNPPATIVFWSDGTKTVVKDQGEENGYDPEKGLAMAISKKMLGNERSYYNTFIHWLKRYEKKQEENAALLKALDNVKQALKKFGTSFGGSSNG